MASDEQLGIRCCSGLSPEMGSERGYWIWSPANVAEPKTVNRQFLVNNSNNF